MGNTHEKLRIKLWIECDTGDSIFGEGQMRILETIQEQGSINAAAKALKMGYRSMWGRLRKMENGWANRCWNAIKAEQKAAIPT